MRQLFGELKWRNVYKVAVTYAAVAFVVAQAARLLQPALLLPDWFYRTVVVAAILGFPVALVIAAAFELIPEGVQRTSAEEGEAEQPSRSFTTASSGFGGRIAALFILLLAAGGAWYLTAGSGEGSSPETAGAADTAPTEPRTGEAHIRAGRGRPDVSCSAPGTRPSSRV